MISMRNHLSHRNTCPIPFVSKHRPHRRQNRERDGWNLSLIAEFLIEFLDTAGDEPRGCHRLSISPARTISSLVSKLFRFRLFGPARSEYFQSRDPLPRRNLHPIAQGLRVVHEFGPDRAHDRSRRRSWFAAYRLLFVTNAKWLSQTRSIRCIYPS